jgi:uncharacterized OsmC-like protein
MSADDGVYTAVAETSTLGIKGRAVTRIRDRNVLVDDPALPQYDNGPGEELGAAELFVAGITTCAALMIERIARAESIPYERCTVRMEATRDMSAPRERGPQAMDSARMHFTWRGISDEHAAYLTDEFQNRCPLYGSVAIATPDTVVTHEVVPAHATVG